MSTAAELPAAFYARSVHEVAPELVGCTLLVDGVGGTIVETEAYDRDDPACHAFNGRTPRNEGLFGPPGKAYVYVSYGIHQLFNVVAEPDGAAAAVLIRAIEPQAGIELMSKRRGMEAIRALCSGPGKLTEALGIGAEHNGADLAAPPFTILAREAVPEIVAAPRIGITRAVERPWRYCVRSSAFLSRPVPAAALL